MRISDWSSDVCSSDLVDLVQEQRAAMRAADAPRLADAAARAVDQVAAEQFGLGQFVRQRGAIDRGQRAAAAPALAVKHVRDQTMPAVATICTLNTQKVTSAPPARSASQPHPARDQNRKSVV